MYRILARDAPLFIQQVLLSHFPCHLFPVELESSQQKSQHTHLILLDPRVGNLVLPSPQLLRLSTANIQSVITLAVYRLCPPNLHRTAVLASLLILRLGVINQWKALQRSIPELPDLHKCSADISPFACAYDKHS